MSEAAVKPPNEEGAGTPQFPLQGRFRVRALGGFGQPLAEHGRYDGRVDRIAFWIARKTGVCGQILSFEPAPEAPGAIFTRPLHVPDSWDWRVAKDETVRVQVAPIEWAGMPEPDRFLAYQAVFPGKDVEVRPGKGAGYVLLRKR